MNDPKKDTKEETRQASDQSHATLEHVFYDEFKGQEITIVCRFARPNASQAQRAQKEMMKSPSRAFSNLTRNVIHPDDKSQYDQHLRAYPGLATTFGGALLKACGYGDLGN